MLPSSEALVEAVPEALKNMLLVLASRGVLRQGWCDLADGSTDLWEATWRASRKISSALTPALLAAGAGSQQAAAAAQQQQQQQQPNSAAAEAVHA
jgi:hypothetical protein